MNRTSTTLTVALLLTMTLAALAPPASAASTHLVCAAGCTFTDIPSALAAAAPGDTVAVRPGIYAGSFTISTPVTLCSTGAGGSACAPSAADTIIDGSSIYPVWIGADDVTVRGFTIRNPSFTITDQTFSAIVDPALVVVAGDRASILDNVLTQPAAAPLPGETRWYTVGVTVSTGSDDLLVKGNTFRDFVPGKGPGAVCPQNPCEVIAIFNWGGGSGFVVENNDIQLGGVGLPATAIQFKSNPGVVIRGNVIRLPGAPVGSGPDSTAIETTTSAIGVLVEGNDIAGATLETRYGAYGVFGVFSGSTFRANSFSFLQHGIMLRTSAAGGNVVENNLFTDNAQGLLNYAVGTRVDRNVFELGAAGVVLNAVFAGGSAGVVLRENTFRDLASTLRVTETVQNVLVDARENDWGDYSAALIRARQDDASGTNNIDVSCFIDADGTTRVCPTAAYTWNILNNEWPRHVRLTDASVSGGRTITNITWSLPDGSVAHTPTVDLFRGPGSASVQLIVTDSEGFQDDISHTIATPNTPPTLSATASASGVEGTTLALSLMGGDAEGDRLTYSMTGGPAGAMLDPATGAFAWDVPYDADGTAYTLSWSVTDGVDTATATTALTVVDTPVAPVLAPIAPRSVLEGATLTAGISAYDPNGGAVTLAASGLPAGSTFTDNADGTATFAWTPAIGASGSHTIDVTATAPNAMATTGTLTVTVTQQVGFTLAFTGPSTIQAAPGEVVHLVARLTNTGSGPDLFGLTASDTSAWGAGASASPTVGSGDVANVEATVTVPAQGGVTLVTLRACSGASPTTCRTLTWRVETPLVVTIDAPAVVTVGGSLAGTVRVTWLDGAAAEGVFLTVEQQAKDLGSIFRSSQTGNTDAAGEFAFSFSGVPATSLGDHVISATATKGAGARGFAQTTYRAGI